MTQRSSLGSVVSVNDVLYVDRRKMGIHGIYISSLTRAANGLLLKSIGVPQ